MRLERIDFALRGQDLSPERGPRPAGELPAVLGVLAHLLGAETLVLTLHPSGGEAECVALAGQAGGGDAVAATLALGDTMLMADARPRAVWSGNILLALLESVPGHSRLVLGFHFAEPTMEQRARANAYVARTPFADGYFDIWQLSRLRSRRCAALEEALDRADHGVVLIGRNAELLFENEAARALIDAGDGLRRARGELRATNLSDSVNLQMVIEHVIARDDDAPDESGQLLALRRREAPPLLALVVPSRIPPLESADVAVAVYLADPKQEPGRALLPVCQLYGLSPVESTLVGHLAAGRTLGVAALAMKIKDHTARGYLKNIFYKTSTNRQTEMVALMLGSLVHVTQRVFKDHAVRSARHPQRLLA